MKSDFSKVTNMKTNIEQLGKPMSGREILALGEMLPFQRNNFAQAAMQGLLANTRFDFLDIPDELADAAFKIADAMIKRSKQ